MRRILLLAIAIGFLAFRFAAAQDAAQTASVYVEARPLERPSPNYPANAHLARREGWVTVSFVISSEGEVFEPMIEQSSGGPLFERAALDAVSRWKYDPATENGVPVDQAMTQTTIFFQLEQPSGASRTFQRAYQELVRRIDGRELQRAATLLAELERNESLNRYETAWLWWAKFVYLSRANPTDEAGMQRALERALGNQAVYLSADQFVGAAERLVVSYARAGDIAAATAMFERLRDSEHGRTSTSHAAAVANVQPIYDRMRELVGGAQILRINGAVGEFDYRVHRLSRRAFSVADVTGRLDSLDIRCSRGTRRYDSVPMGTVWRVPATWGGCGLYFKGQPGTTFGLLEYPTSAEPAAAIDVSARERVAQ